MAPHFVETETREYVHNTRHEPDDKKVAKWAHNNAKEHAKQHRVAVEEVADDRGGVCTDTKRYPNEYSGE